MKRLGEKANFKLILPMAVAAIAIAMATGTVSQAEGTGETNVAITTVMGAVLEDGIVSGAELGHQDDAGLGFQAESVVSADMEDCSLVIQTGKYVYSGMKYEPSVAVTYTDPVSGKVTVLEEGEDYQVSYAENVNAGQGKVTVTGMGDFTGTKTSEFVIARNTLDQCTIKMEYTEVMGDGNQKKPQIKVFYNGSPLSANKDYSVTYSNNVDAGVANVEIKGINNWSGTVAKTFTIKYSAVKDFAFTPTSGMIALTWDKLPNVTGYEVFRSTSASGDYTKLASVTINAYNDVDVSTNETYFYKIRAYGNIDGNLEYGAYTNPLEASAGAQVAAAIIPYEGVKYVYGGSSPKGWDCSGFTQWIMANKFGVDIPRTAREQAKVGTKVNINNQEEWLPGDLIFFSKGSRVSHVGVYIGDGKMMHASSTYKKTMIVDINDYNRRCTENNMTHVRRVL